MATRNKKSNGISRLIIIGVVLVVVFNIGFSIFEETSDGGSAEYTKSGEEIQRPFSGEGYVLSFGEDFKPGLSTVDDLGLSVLIAVDVSGSMDDPPSLGAQEAKYLQATRVLEQISAFLEEQGSGKNFSGLTLKVGLIGFDSEIREIFPLSIMNPNSFNELRKRLADPTNLEPGGKTAIGLALERGAEILSQSGTILKSLIVISDGENTSGTSPEEVLWALNENRNNFSTVDFPVTTRGILVSFVGFDIDAGYFSELQNLGARITSAADQDELFTALQDTLVADINKLEAAAP